uniref:Uncharacterized protein n=1 Tax=Arundo donax TaxID=35708 RepID=A0A0A9BFT5_ARUDO
MSPSQSNASLSLPPLQHTLINVPYVELSGATPQECISCHSLRTRSHLLACPTVQSTTL